MRTKITRAVFDTLAFTREEFAGESDTAQGMANLLHKHLKTNALTLKHHDIIQIHTAMLWLAGNQKAYRNIFYGEGWEWVDHNAQMEFAIPSLVVAQLALMATMIMAHSTWSAEDDALEAAPPILYIPPSSLADQTSFTSLDVIWKDITG